METKKIVLQIGFFCKIKSEISNKEHKNIKLNKCYFCGSNVNSYYSYIINDMEFEICGLCNIVCNYNYKNIKNCVVCWSKMTQNDINMRTNIFINKNNRIPNIHEIDKNAKIINLSFPLISLFYEYGNENDINKIQNIKLFFTDRINVQQIKNIGNNIFSKNNNTKIKQKDGFEFYVTNQIDKINIPEEQHNIIIRTANSAIEAHGKQNM